MDFNLLIELTLILVGALLGGLVFFKLGQAIVIGYIFAGLLLGSFFPNFKSEAPFVSLIAEIGVALLLFTIGLEFSLDRLKKVGKPGILGAVLQILIVVAIFALLLPQIFGFSYKTALFLGAIASLSSTALVSKMLSEKGELESSYGDLILAWLIVQDLAVVPLMLILPVLTQEKNIEVVPILLSIIKAVITMYLIFMLGKKGIPFIFKKLALFDNRELLLVSAFLFCIGLATISEFIGLSFSIGAFLAGMLLSTSVVNHEVFTEIRPLRDLFSSIFFVSLGYLISFSTILENVWLILLVSALVIVFKVIVVLFLVLFFNYHSKLAFVSSLALFQIGEFSFILAKLGFDKGILNLSVYQIAISSSLITLILTPFIFSKATVIYKFFRNFVKKYVPHFYRFLFKILDSDAKMPRPRKLKIKDHIVLVGYGRVGKYIGRILDLTGNDYVIIDLHYKTISDLRRRGVHSIYGDAINEDVLGLAQIAKAKGIVIAVPDVVTSELVLKSSRRMNPGIKVIARAHREEDIARLSIRGVKDIIEPEFEASLEMGERILKILNHKSHDIASFITKVRDERRY